MESWPRATAEGATVQVDFDASGTLCSSSPPLQSVDLALATKLETWPTPSSAQFLGGLHVVLLALVVVDWTE